MDDPTNHSQVPEPPAPSGTEAPTAPGESHSPEESFAALLESAEDRSLAPDLEVGQKVEGTIVKLDESMAFLDVGRKGEATIAVDELRDQDGTVNVAIGDKLTAFVVSTAGGVLLSKVLAHGLTTRSALEDAVKSGMPIEGLVTGVNKGGLEIEVSGTRAFCPMSQIDLRFCENPAAFVGQRHRFRVTQFAEGGRKIVVSRRAILEEEAGKIAGEVRKRIEVGAHLRGRVVSLRDFGAFVDLGGGIEGLIHVSELSHAHVAHAKDVLSVGQEVDVQVIRIEAPREGKDQQGKRRRPPSERIALSLKSLAEDPWATARAAFPEGSAVTGKVVRLQPFGAFVELAPGIDGLLHVSNIVADRKINHPKDVLEIGQTIEATVLSVDEERKRIGLTLLSDSDRERRREAKRPAGAVSVGQVVEGEIDRVEPFGVFVRIDGGGRGLIPNSELGTPKSTDHRKAFPPGTRVRAAILEHDPATGRIRLSRKGAEDADQRADYEGYVQSQPRKGGFGTFADLLKPKS
ncbi:MAG: S1 RNA-binding domain-containing protein [Deltaproteobacteria bacterium]|nr:S1 RNA-binding domain-containing protein [Deltaproteobacteria bacterium]